VVRAKETRYRVPGWGVGELWTSDRAVLAHEFAFEAATGVEPRGESRSQARLLEGAASPPLGTLPGQQAREGNGSVPTPRRPATEAELDPDELVARVTAYLAGADVAFDGVPLDLGDCTAFQQAVAFALRAIPRGEVVGYGELAAVAGYPGAARAVGTFCARNPFAFFLPCHRVVAADGIGGYGSAGIAVKRRLLALEGVTGLAA
jgi:methylated-DNA-[protein]-cysteine S-methyltransferase